MKYNQLLFRAVAKIYPKKFSKISFLDFLLVCVPCKLENQNGKSPNFKNFKQLYNHTIQKHKTFKDRKTNLDFKKIIEIIKYNSQISKEFEK